MVKMSINDIEPILTPEEIAELELAEKMAPVHDDDCPEMTPEKLAEFKRAADQMERTKQTISLRLSPQTLTIAKAYGKGYTSFLSRLLDAAIKDEALVKKCI